MIKLIQLFVLLSVATCKESKNLTPLTAAENEERAKSCGILKHPSPDGMAPTMARDAPWIVGVKTNHTFRTGFLLSKRHVLVDARLFQNRTSPKLFGIQTKNPFKAALPTDPNSEFYVIVHLETCPLVPCLSPKTKKRRASIIHTWDYHIAPYALLELSSPVDSTTICFSDLRLLRRQSVHLQDFQRPGDLWEIGTITKEGNWPNAKRSQSPRNDSSEVVVKMFNKRYFAVGMISFYYEDYTSFRGTSGLLYKQVCASIDICSVPETTVATVPQVTTVPVTSKPTSPTPTVTLPSTKPPIVPTVPPIPVTKPTVPSTTKPVPTTTQPTTVASTTTPTTLAPTTVVPTEPPTVKTTVPVPVPTTTIPTVPTTTTVPPTTKLTTVPSTTVTPTTPKPTVAPEPSPSTTVTQKAATVTREPDTIKKDYTLKLSKISAEENNERHESCGPEMSDEPVSFARDAPWIAQVTNRKRDFTGLLISKRHVLVDYKLFKDVPITQSGGDMNVLFSLPTNKTDPYFVKVYFDVCVGYKSCKSTKKEHKVPVKLAVIQVGQRSLSKYFYILELSEDLRIPTVCIAESNVTKAGDKVIILNWNQESSLSDVYKVKEITRKGDIHIEKPWSENLKPHVIVQRIENRMMAVGLHPRHELGNATKWYAIGPLSKVICDLTGVCPMIPKRETLDPRVRDKSTRDEFPDHPEFKDPIGEDDMEEGQDEEDEDEMLEMGEMINGSDKKMELLIWKIDNAGTAYVFLAELCLEKMFPLFESVSQEVINFLITSGYHSVKGCGAKHVYPVTVPPEQTMFVSRPSSIGYCISKLHVNTMST